MMKLGVIFGSRSAEHDVSIVSGLQLLENADKGKYDAFPVYISRAGRWFVGEPLRRMGFYRNFDPKAKGLTQVFLPPVPGAGGLYAPPAGLARAKTIPLDCAVLALHGMNGEDGTVQGLLELADIPYTSAGVTGSGVGMDKIIMKAVFESMGLPVLPGRHYHRDAAERDMQTVMADAEQLGYPLFVKPANLGSSIGIGRARDRGSLEQAIRVAISYDRRILIEKGLEQPVEINCACLGGGDEAIPSLCEQPAGLDEFLTFEDKYTRGGSSKGMKSLTRRVPAPIADELTARIQRMTVDIFRMLECKGVVRVDYMIDPATGTLYVNEINTIPGSFAYYLFQPMGISYPALIDKLVEGAFAAQAQQRRSSFAFASDILQKAMSGHSLLKK